MIKINKKSYLQYVESRRVKDISSHLRIPIFIFNDAKRMKVGVFQLFFPEGAQYKCPGPNLARREPLNACVLEGFLINFTNPFYPNINTTVARHIFQDLKNQCDNFKIQSVNKDIKSGFVRGNIANSIRQSWGRGWSEMGESDAK